jgi:DNA helicase II / ATP-dependent DNA helicase PcrA
MKPSGKLLERMKTGNGLVLYGFEQENDEATEFIEAVHAEHGDCPIFSVPQKLSAIQNSDAFGPILIDIETVRNRIRRHLPLILTVNTTLEALTAAKGDIFEDNFMIDKICLADGLVSLARSDLFVVPNAQASLEILQQNEMPQTPIESELCAAMTRLGLQFEEQVRLGKFTADFVVNKGKTSLVVEADGAEFHNADTDQRRDKEILNDHGFKTLRFSGAKICSDAVACAQEVERFLKTLIVEETQYRFEELQQLDPSQQKAVMHGTGHARVLAPAGSGKTRVLVNRVSYLLNSGIKPGAIVAIAFNKKAADQLEDRLIQLGVPVAKNLTDRSGVVVATFNALGYRLLLDNGFDGRLLSSEARVRELVRSALKKAGIQLPSVRGSDNLDRVIRQLARVSRGLMNPNAEELEIVAQKGETVKLSFPPIYTAVRDLQSEQRTITFDDQISNALTLTMSEPIVRHELQRRFQHILVDEYQDLNKAQISLIRTLASGNGQIYAVGDDDQLIYSWREAKAQHLLQDFERYFPKSTTFALETNYRCAQRIVELSQRLISYNKNRFPKTIRPSPNAPKGDVVVQGYDSIKSQSQRMVAFLKDHYKSDVCDWIDMAVLSRTKVQLVEVARALDEAKIPRSILPNIPLFSSPIGRVLHRYLLIIHAPDKARGDDFAIIINRPNRYTTNEFRELLSKSQEPIMLLQDYVENAYPENEKYRAEPVQKFLKDIRGLNSKIINRSIYETVTAIISAFDLVSVNLDGKAAELDEADDESIVEIIVEEARRFQSLEQFLEHYEKQIRIETGDDKDESKVATNGAGDGLDVDEETSRDVVSLNTIHATKGREWGLCFIFDVRDTPQRGEKSVQKSPADDEEERRVFYVAVTRARHSLGITTRTSRPSPFLREAFLSRETEKAGIATLQSAVHKEEVELADKMVKQNSFQSQIRQLETKAAYIRTGKFRTEMEAQVREIGKLTKELEKEINHWRKKAPDGFLKRIVSGGFSMRDIEARISDLIGRQNTLYAEMDEATENIRQGSSYVDDQLGKTKLKTDHLERQIELFGVEISSAQAVLNDTKNLYEVFRLFQNDVPE